jgi:hypothetical protein
MALIKHLKDIPEFEFIIEEGAEDQIMSNNFKVKYLRKDAKACL